MFNATSPLGVDEICVDEIEACACIKGALSWGPCVSVDTSGAAKLVSGLSTEGDVCRRGIQWKLYSG